MKLVHRKLKTVAHHGACPDHIGVQTRRPVKASPWSMQIDEAINITTRQLDIEAQHGPCYRIDPSTGERTKL